MIEKAILNNSFGDFRDDKKIVNWTVVGEVVFIERGFFRSVVKMEYVSGDGKVPVERERLTILQIVCEIEEDNSLSRLVGMSQGYNKNLCIRLCNRFSMRIGFIGRRLSYELGVVLMVAKVKRYL